MHRDADRRHRHAQRGTSLTYVLSSRPRVKLSAAPPRSSVCLPPRGPCVSRHIKPDHTRATIAPGVYARDLGSKVDVLSRQSSPSTRIRRHRGLRVGIHSHLRRDRKGPPVAAHCSHRGGPPPEARSSWSAHAAERSWPAHLGSMCNSRSRSWHTPVPGVAWALCAAHIARAVGTLASDPFTDPRPS